MYRINHTSNSSSSHGDISSNGNEAGSSDVALLNRAVAGDESALETLFARSSRGLYQTALRLLGNAEDAEDALQDGMLSAYRNLRRFEGRSKFSTWLTRIVINAALMRRRSRRTHREVSLDADDREEQVAALERFPDEGPSPEQICAGSELRERLRENLDDLSPMLRRAFELREIVGLTTSEAAKVLGVSRNTLKARSWRARHQVAQRLSGFLDRGVRSSRRQNPLSAGFVHPATAGAR